MHYIGKVIATRRMSYARTDIHSIQIGTGLMDQIKSDEYADRDRLYMLLQQNLLEFLFKKYRVEGKKREATTDDKVWVAGILFNDSQL